MVKAIILDVDGVIVGDKAGYNFPDPNPYVLKVLNEIRQKGIYISLCTAKPSFAIEKIINDAYLNNLHITDGGAVIIDPIDKLVAAQHTISKDITQKVIEYYLAKNIYQEFYTASEYYIVQNQKSELTTKHSLTLQRDPQYIDDVNIFLKNNDLVKIFLIAKNDEEKTEISQTFTENFDGILTLSWSQHPSMLLWQFGIITAKGISKQKGAFEISQNLQIPLENILGVGDTTHDWQFIKECGYAAAMGNATSELKELVSMKGNQGYIGGNVNENGIIEILNYFMNTL